MIGLNDFSWGFYPSVDISFHIYFIIYFVLFFTVSITLLLFAFMFFSPKSQRIQITRVKYVFFATVIGSFAGIDFLPNYGINVFPIGFIFMFPVFRFPLF